MASYEPINNINQLPDKVLCAIFNYLDEEEVKEASLVCSRWNGIIFHSPYIDRFQLTLPSGPYTYRERDMLDTIDPNLFGISLTRKQKQLKRKVRQQFRQQMINEVLQSRRCYRNIYYPMYYDFALQAMSTHRLQQLQMVELLLDNECFSSLDIWITFANAIPLMEQLHTLYLKSYASSFVYPYNVAPIVRSNSLRHLTVDKVFPVTADMPALATYEGPLSALHRLGPNMPRNQFDMMHKLFITDSEYSNKWMANDYREFFRRLPNIQTIKYMCDESGNGFTTAMSEASNTLQELVCGTRDISSFHLLSNLTSLRRLELYSDNWSSAPVTGSYDLGFPK
ncbi:uncharacterized protein LOC118464799 isoform X3 [Anopheles albimanus]|uniref:uncharacterized protein LOC118464799 isoform X3 n=1 Tax=Anopheles albimanus TaxID=7167 RepID=UPI0016415165|nr:uncharacterized protein LOC118464799 isoform X3 [Anopheles albimanus]